MSFVCRPFALRSLVVLGWLALAACSDAATTASQPPPGDTKDSGTTTDGGTPDAAPLQDAQSPDAAPPDAGLAANEARIVVHYSEGVIALRGALAGLNWDNDFATTVGGVGVYSKTVHFAQADGDTLEYKPRTAGTWAIGPNYKITRGTEAHVYPHFTQMAGRVDKFRSNFKSTRVPATRNLWVYSPPTAIENKLARFPVLYMHDAQNLFDPTQAFGGVAWAVDGALDNGAADGSLREVYVIGIDNTADRSAELTPVPDASEGGGGNGDAYLAMIESEIKPLVDAELRTLPARETTGIMGSSLGGLISVYAGTTHGQTFGLVGAMSPSTFWANEYIVTQAKTWTNNPNRPVRLYLDSGDSGVAQDDVNQTARLADSCRSAGFKDNQDFFYTVGQGDSHNETAWAKRLPRALAFLLGPGR